VLTEIVVVVLLAVALPMGAVAVNAVLVPLISTVNTSSVTVVVTSPLTIRFDRVPALFIISAVFCGIVPGDISE